MRNSFGDPSNRRLPPGWNISSLSEVATIESGGNAPQDDRFFSEGSFPFVRVQHFDGTSTYVDRWDLITDEAADRYRLKMFPPGSIVFPKSGASIHLEKRAKLPRDAYVVSHLAVVQALPDKCDADFLYFCLRTISFSQISTGTSLPFLSLAEISKREISIPPIPEQRAIAGVLAKIQAAVEVQEKIVATLKELKAATMAKLFREGLRGEPLKQTEIGAIPETWEVVPLGKIAAVGNGSTPKRTNPVYWEGGIIPWLTSAKVHETFIRMADEFVTEMAKRECHLPLVRKRSLVVAITGQGKTLGNVALVTFDTCVSQHLAYVQFQIPGVVPEFFLAFLKTRYQDLREVSRAGGSTKGALTCRFLETYLVPLPPLDEQRSVAEVVSKLDARMETEKGQLVTLRSLLNSMLHLLMTGQVRVTRRMIALQALAERVARRPKWSGTVDEKILQEVVRRIVEAVAPEKIVLFGSAVRGEMGPDSDLDLLIVKECENWRETARAIRRQLIGVGRPIDVVVATPEAVEEQKDIPGMIVRAALREGRVLYAA